MINPYEVRFLEIEYVDSVSDVIGSVRGVNGRITGSTKTYHSNIMRAEGRTYEFHRQSKKHSFSEGDKVFVLCKKNQCSGVYDILSYINKSSGIQYIVDPKAGLRSRTIIIIFSIIASILFFLPVLYVPFAIYNRIKYKRTTYKYIVESLVLLNKLANS
ncbi:hypothetical protein [uncultured Amphritea sp.]|uniref:hypothetical protein n=1 Tax=uncultured Amphritea sp. TaxID=981605 RepID=UPI0025CD3F0B|nr:hypothetical protein [uncultured Amphritea sp.]